MRLGFKAVCLCFLSFTSMAIAEETKESGAYLLFQGNYAFKTKPDVLKDEWKNGKGGGFGVEYAFSPKVAVQLNANFNVFGFDEERVHENLEGLGTISFEISPLSMLGLDIEVVYSFLQQDFTPYAFVGLGFLGILGGDGYVYVNNHEYYSPLFENNGFLVKPGVGIKYQKLDKVGFYLQAAIDFGLTPGEKYVAFPISLGFTLPMSSKLAQFLTN